MYKEVRVRIAVAKPTQWQWQWQKFQSTICSWICKISLPIKKMPNLLTTQFPTLKVTACLFFLPERVAAQATQCYRYSTTILAVARCLVFVTRWSSSETVEQIKLFFGMEASFNSFYTVSGYLSIYRYRYFPCSETMTQIPIENIMPWHADRCNVLLT